MSRLSWVHRGAARPQCEPHLVRPVRSLTHRRRWQSAPQLEQPHFAHLAPRRDHQREQNHVGFRGDLILNLRDSYLSTQRQTIFQHVGITDLHLLCQRTRCGQGCRVLPRLYRRAAEVFARRGRVSPRSQDGYRGRRRVELCPSGCLVRASTTRRCTRYTIRRHSVSHAFLALFPSHIRVSGLTNAGMVENREHHHPQPGRHVQAPDDVHLSPQRDRGHPVRTDNLSRYRSPLPPLHMTAPDSRNDLSLTQ